eukprot:GHRR01011314.1.p1 GENE.GHRR01011314.1~~GHRR01011314.1.p1  ORF type:complete len:584 (+),score=168.73 GHRR01011314.1:153-1904(+)
MELQVMKRLRRFLTTTLKAIAVCHCQRAAPTIATVFEIAALAAPLIRTHDTAATEAGHSTAYSSSSSNRHPRSHPIPGPIPAPLQLLVGIGLRLAKGWAPAVVVAQGVRLVGSLVPKRDNQDDQAGGEGTEVRALQLGLSVVPRVDPRVPRSLAEYCAIYREWLLLLRGRLAQSGLELPDMFDPEQDGDEELMRFALCYNILQARSLKDALVAMDRTVLNIKEFVVWYSKYSFIKPGDLEAWQRIAWWEGPDSDGHLWLMIDFRAAVQASRTHGPDLVARVLVSFLEYGVRHLVPELGCASTVRVVVDASGVHIGAATRARAVFQRVGHVVNRMYPCRLQVLYMVGLPFPLRWGTKAGVQLLHVHTRRKIRMCKATDVPRRLPSQLRSHKLSVGAGLDGWAYLDTGDYYAEGREGPVVLDDWEAAHEDGVGPHGAGSGAESVADIGDAFTPTHVRGTAPRRRFRWRPGRFGQGDAAVGGGGAHSASGARVTGGRRVVRVSKQLAWATTVLLGSLLLIYALMWQQVARDNSRRVLEWLSELLAGLAHSAQRPVRHISGAAGAARQAVLRANGASHGQAAMPVIG